MRTIMRSGGLVAAAIAAALTVASPASARPFGHHGGYHGGGAAIGFAAGALIGGALASRPYYGYGSYGAYGYDEPYVVDDGYAAAGSGGGDVQYCLQRFKSYDPSSGTYLGYDGIRHPCP